MNQSRLFTDRDWFSNPWEVPFLFLVGIIALSLWFTLMRLNASRPANVYDPQRAWLRAILYFFACFLISWLSGVLNFLLNKPFALNNQTSSLIWWIGTGGLLIIVGYGYGVVWRQGTVFHGRQLAIGSTLLFGILWGLSTGQLLLSIWALIEKIDLGIIAATIGTCICGGMLNGLWHAKYWDIKVAPDHNIIETNTRKILLAHTPNLTLSVIHMAIFANPHIFVLTQVIALTISALAMRFPPFYGPSAAMVAQHDPRGRPRL